MAQTTESVAVTPVAKKVLVEVISEFLSSKSPIPVPRPLIREAVSAILDSVPEIDLATVRSVLADLPISAPADWVRLIWSEFSQRVEDDRESCDLECPETGNTITLEDGDGEYTCPECDADIVVEYGEATHAIEVECPVAEEAFWAGPEDGTYPCPCCDLEVTVQEGKAEHDDVVEVQCPMSKDKITFDQGPGEYTCPDCGGDIEVDEEGHAKHARAAAGQKRPSKRR